MGEVYLGNVERGPGFKKRVAVKRVRHGEVSPEVTEMFHLEADLALRLSHPNIVQTYDYLHTAEGFLLVMEFVEGRTLEELIVQLASTHQLLPMDCALFITMQVLKALDYAHTRTDSLSGKGQNMVHRDITPRNIMISYDAIIKLLDFGIAARANRTRWTQTGLVRGTVQYMPPERAAGLNEDLRGDLFSLGSILYELLAGRPLFQGTRPRRTHTALRVAAGV